MYPRNAWNITLNLHSVPFLSVVFQSYSVNVMDENVLRGNTAIVKCHIPSFVSDFVVVDSWIELEDDEQKEYQYNTLSFGRKNSIFFSYIKLYEFLSQAFGCKAYA